MNKIKSITAVILVAAVLHAVTAFILSTDMAKAAAKGEKIAGWIIYTVFEIVTAVLLVTAALMM